MRRLPTLALATVVSLPLGACAANTAAPGYSATVATQLQHDVLMASRAAAAKNVPAATAALIDLQRHLGAAQRAGTVSGARAAGIEAAATKVTADLDALAAASAAQPTPTQAPTPTPTAAATAPPAHGSAPAPARRPSRPGVVRPPEHHRHGDGKHGGRHGGGGHGGHGDQ